MSIEAPFYLLLIPLWVALAWMGMRVRLPLGFVPEKGRSPSFRAFLPTWGTAILASIGSIALSRPHLRFLDKGERLPDLWVLWDVSRSMQETDIAPTRQRYAVESMEAALTHSVPSRLGLIIFASKAYAVLPLTEDKDAFLFSLRQVARLDLGEGTNLADAIETALALIENHPAEILIISDGAHNMPGTPSLAALAEKAHEQRIRIHTVFIGQEGSQVYPEALRLLSEKTGGAFQEKNINLTSLLLPQQYYQTYPLAPYLWLGVLIGGLILLGAMAVGGWFSVLTA
ncbi:MAG: VWA domain-containing protein [Bacteroidia bacterium]|nr:VWA domain-containing protein [Bacteroidia bacterium]MCX7763979.1 VWA domain-containing protein [Bacteroidia bacterium]MDW8058397.1 VWA domain-containing protein [Bacteroidia bacterium]